MDSKMMKDCDFPTNSDDEGRRHAKWVGTPFELGLNVGPFHYMVRASGYGELYDGIPWKVMFGVSPDKDRSGSDRSSRVCQYKGGGVLIHNWLEEGRDRERIKFSRTGPISQFGHIYKTTYGTSIGKKWVCDKESPPLRTISEFPRNVYPGHQPELDVNRIQHCVPKPQACILREEKEACFERKDHRKRVAKLNPYSTSSTPISGSDLAKC